MSKTLHILNGDSKLPISEQSGIKGDVVWHEMLCDGPLKKEVGNEEFWRDRPTYFEKEIVRELLILQQSETVYGFGDVQYFQYLKKLNNYITVKDSGYYLNDAGKTVVLQ